MPDQNKFHKTKFSQEVKMRDKIKFEKLEEISLEEIQGEENGELNKVQNKDSQRLRKGPKPGPLRLRTVRM